MNRFFRFISKEVLLMKKVKKDITWLDSVINKISGTDCGANLGSCNNGPLYYKWDETQLMTSIASLNNLCSPNSRHSIQKIKKPLTLCFIDALTEWKKLLLTAKKPVWTFVNRKQPRRAIFPIICDASAKTGYQKKWQ